MSSHRPKQSSLAYLVDLAFQIQRDAERPEAELHRRDRVLVSRGIADTGDRACVLRQWLDALRDGAAEGLPGRLVERVHRLQVALMAFLGLACGWATAASVFAYDGSRPVNVVHVLAVFVGLQLLLLVFLGVVLLPGGLVMRVVGLGGLQDLLLWLSPGQLLRLIARVLPSNVRAGLLKAFPMRDVRAGPLGGVVKWSVVHSAQVAGVGFYCGALATALSLIAFSDLAFSWSTTLDLRQEQVHGLTKVLSRPWAGVLAPAVPSLDLVRETQYFRQTGVVGDVEPGRWGAWWPFLIACMVLYGWLPRVALWGLSAWRLRVAIRRGFCEMPGSSLVWDRLTSHWVSTQSGEEEEVPGGGGVESAEPARGRQVVMAGEFQLVNWGGLELADSSLTVHVQEVWRAGVVGVLHAGGRASVEVDTGVVESVANLPETVGVAVFVKAWEPPVLELTDFLREMRQATGPQRLVVVCLVGWDPVGGATPPDEASVRQWDRRISAERDPCRVVRPWPGGVAS